MDRRTKILGGLFGLAVLYALLSGVVYPRWIKEWINLDDRIAERQAVLDKLQALEDQVNEARYEYRELVGRAGLFDIVPASTDVHERLNQLIERHKLKDAKVTPNRPAEDRKTGLASKVISVSASGDLQACIEFLRDVSELPHLLRTGNVTMSPASSSSRRDVAQDVLNLRVPVEVWVLPQQRIVGLIRQEDLVQPDMYVRHQGREYFRIWDGQPFTEFVPLTAQTTPTVNVQTDTPVTLDVSATGGRGSYTYQWAPPTGLSDPTAQRPKVDTSTAGSKRYTVTVTDASGRTAMANVMVSVREPPAVAQADPTPQPQTQPVDPGPQPWRDGHFKELRMALLQRIGDRRLDEFMLYDSQKRTNEYYKVGDEFDGGELIFVHQTGGVARRKDEYFVYPLGMTVAQSMPAADASEYPELQRAAEYYRNASRDAVKPSAQAGPDEQGAVVVPEVPSAASSPVEFVGPMPTPEGSPSAAAAAEKRADEPVAGKREPRPKRDQPVKRTRLKPVPR